MNKVVALFLITVFLCANTLIGQFLKIPNLIEHYNEYKNEVTTNSNSFTQFIIVHYSKNTDNNQKEHQNLPFKTFDNSNHVLFTFSNVSFQLEIIKPFILAKEKFFYEKLFKSNLFTSIWLPPKIA
jgi:predicted PurR-regulated permease PerM